MKENIFRSIEKKVEEIEKKQDLKDFIIASTNLNEKHMMRMEEEYSSFAQQMDEVYQDLTDLELADLLDYQRFVGKVDGEFD